MQAEETETVESVLTGKTVVDETGTPAVALKERKEAI